jgi:hypothetical protein
MAQDEALTVQEISEINMLAKKWAADRKMHLIRNVQSLGLVRSGKLVRSIKSGIRLSYGELNAIYFKYEWYGLFHEKGASNVGRQRVNLPAKHWLAPYVYGEELDSLVEELSEFYMNIAVRTVRIDDVKA